MLGFSPYLIIGALVAVIASGFGGYLKGSLDASAECRSAEVAASLATTKADLRIKESSLADAEGRVAGITAVNKANGALIQKLHEDLTDARNRPPETRVVTKTRTVVLRSCPAGAGAERLRAIR